MLNNYFTLKAAAEFLKDKISGYVIKDIFTQEKNKLLIAISEQGSEDPVMLEYSIEKDLNYIIVKDHFSKSKKNFAGMFEEVYGKCILGVSQFNDDRAISFTLSDGNELIFTFFSNKANCFLTGGKTIISAFKDKNEFHGKNISDIFPLKKAASSEDDKDITADKFVRIFYRKYGDLYRREALFNAKLNGNEAASEAIRENLRNEFAAIDDNLLHPQYLLYSNRSSFHLSLIRLDHLSEYSSNKFDNINDLIYEYNKLKFRIEKTGSLKNKALSELKLKIAGIDKKIEGVNNQLLHCENSEKLREKGEVILQNIYHITKGDRTFKYSDADGIYSTIDLKEELNPQENAKRYFDKYKKQKGSVEILRDRLDNFRKEKQKLVSELERVDKMTEYKTLVKEDKRSGEKKNDETLKFRKFVLNDKFEVWVGKDSASNDLLTTKYTAQNDLWFHVRGASGSHTVLKINNKKENVEKEFIKKAASIAAYYSKARNASNVPVAYCEKKYVKKKKGFKQGSVVMEREKVIFVKPGLPVSS